MIDRLSAAILFFAVVAPAMAGRPACKAELVLPPQPVAESNLQAFSTPLAYADGALYTVQIEADELDDPQVGLNTVVLKGVAGPEGWRWSRTLLEPETMNNPWHTAGSIGVDEAGHVHVAYNMHNTPWQYAVSRRPGDISSFEFRGQRISKADKLHQVRGNGAPRGYDRYGDAAIPGAQVSYPAFFNDAKGRLYVTYRHTLRPALPWQERALAGGVARYSSRSGKWEALGGRVDLKPGEARNVPADQPFKKTLIFQPGWTVYFVQLAFDQDNGMHLSWLWREGGPGRDSQYPSYAYSPAGSEKFYAADGRLLTLPISLSDADTLVARDDGRKFLSQTSLAVDDRGRPSVVTTTEDGERILFDFDARSASWIERGETPAGAEVFNFEPAQDGTLQQWAFASGPKIFRRSFKKDGSAGKWRKLAGRKGFCGSDVIRAGDESGFFVRTAGPGGCRSHSEAIFKIPICPIRD